MYTDKKNKGANLEFNFAVIILQNFMDKIG